MRFADRLLERFVPGQDHDALLGDLREERERGRSALWFCAQILAAIVVGSWKAVRTNKGAALGAIAAGFGFQMAFGNALLLVRIAARHSGHPVTWIVDELLQISSDMVLGWSLVRLFRAHGVTLLLAFRAAMLASLLIVTLWSDSLFAIRTVTALAVLLFQSMVMLAGGYLATQRSEAA